MTVEELPKNFLVKCKGPSVSTVVYGRIDDSDFPELSDVHVTFGVKGYTVGMETVELLKTSGLSGGMKLIKGNNSYKVHSFEISKGKHVGLD